MKIIEVIYPEFQNIYAELYNIEYLKKCNKNIKVIYTHYNDEPYFVNNDVDMIYMGSMPDSKIEPTIKKLTPYKDRIKAMIDNNTLFLITGNALEIFGEKVIDDKKINGLNIFKYTAIKDMNKKYSSWYLGKYRSLNIIGHKSQFSILQNVENGFITTIKGCTTDMHNSNEGIHYKKFYGTYLLGPILILNPKFTKLILKELGLKDALAFEKDIVKAYQLRLKELEKPNARIEMGTHG